MLIAVVVLLAATPQTPITLAAPGLSGVNVSPALQGFVSDHLNQQLVLAGLEVLSSNQVAAVIGLERQKQLLGCNETNCVAELAGALGVDGLVLGNIARFGEKLQLDVRVAAASDARNLAVFSISIDGEAGIPGGVTKAADAIAAQLAAGLGRTLTPVRVQTETRWAFPRKVGMWLTIGGAIALITSFVVLIAAPTATATQPEPPGYWAYTGTGMGLLVGGGLSVLVGGGLWAFGGNVEVPVTAGFAPTQGGFAFAFGGRF